MEQPKPKRRCKDCGRMVIGLSRGMCGKCYRVWQRDNFPPNAICDVCGRPYFRRACASQKGRTCSRDCFRIWKVGRDQHNEPTDRAVLVERNCEWCDQKFSVEKRQIDKGFGRFCSLQCSAESKAVPRLLLSCERCGSSYEFLPNRVFITGARFCSRKCYDATRREQKLPRETDRNRTYRTFRDSLLKDQLCTRCGSKRDLVLHHCIRTRERPDLLYDPNNLIVLCRSCHTQLHGELGHMQIIQTERGVA